MNSSKVIPTVTLLFTLAFSGCDAGDPEAGSPAENAPTTPAAGGLDIGEGPGARPTGGGPSTGDVTVDQRPGVGPDTTTDTPMSGADTTASGIR